MATVDRYYDISLQMNEETVDIAPASYSFEIEDSIHMIYPRLRFNINDVSGLFQEYLVTIEGLKYKLTYGNGKNSIESRYVVEADALSEIMSSGTLNGVLQVDLIHEFSDQQKIISAAHEDRISLIVHKFANKYKFKKIRINDTGNQDIWYQPLITDMEMVEQMLLRYAYSTDAFMSPFFCFIDAGNSFQFRNYKSMIDATPVADLVLFPEGPSTAFDPNIIKSIRRVHVGTETLGPLKRRDVFTIDYTDGSLNTDEDNLASYPSSTRKLGVIENEPLVKSFLYQGITESTSGRSQNTLGEQVASMRDTLFLERFIIDVLFNPLLLAGRMVNLDIKTFKSERGDDSSLTFRGNYIIENSKHIWMGPSQMGITRLLVSKKETSVPASYYIGKRFMTP